MPRAPVLAAAIALALAGCDKQRPVASAGLPPDGAALFQSYCARCHGPRGEGGPPPVAGGAAATILRSAAFLSSRSDAQLIEAIRDGKRGHMPPFGQVLDPAQLQAVVEEIRGFGRRVAAVP